MMYFHHFESPPKTESNLHVFNQKILYDETDKSNEYSMDVMDMSYWEQNHVESRNHN